jgi:uncharacterized protein (TIGR02246 family)
MFTLPTPDTSRRTDPAAVASPILQQLEQAWNDADGAAFGAVFADEMDFVNVRGEHHRGDGAYIGRAHQGIFDTIYADSTVTFRLDVARVLEPGIVMAVASSTLEVPGGPLQGIHNARMTMVIVEDRGDWRITAFHNTLVAEGG